MKFKILFLLFFLLTIISCNNDDDCINKSISTTSLENEYGCTNTKNGLEVELTEDYIIISNQADFTNQVTGSCNPDIDFATYDLVIGKRGLTTGNDSIHYELRENCKTNNYVLEVTFNQNESTIAPNLTYHRLIPKLTGKEFTVEFQN